MYGIAKNYPLILGPLEYRRRQEIAHKLLSGLVLDKLGRDKAIEPDAVTSAVEEIHSTLIGVAGVYLTSTNLVWFELSEDDVNALEQIAASQHVTSLYKAWLARRLP